MFLLEDSPNKWSFYIIVAQGFFGLATLAGGWLLNRKANTQDSKLNVIHDTAARTEVLANGNLAAEKRKSAALEAQLTELGHVPRQEPS